MNINLTLIVQMIVFVALVWVTMKFVWPKIIDAMEERSAKIAAGLAAAEKAKADLVQADERAEAIVKEARAKAAQILDLAGKRSNEMVEEAKGAASAEAQRLVAQAHEEAVLEASRARESLRREVGRLAIEGAERLLEREIDPKTQAELLDKLTAEVARG
ncbi:MAG TPA: F0F1 ATP synthase subunit B [Steroidobacteraceae bacterium]|nr:F0F1 ATP synthase subunit B [Steroidobacteraceae bacterium]